jgi:uncharacterized membrane protein YkgB
MKIGIYNHETGEQEVRDMNSEELAQLAIEKEQAIAKESERLAIIEAKNAILTRLGLTETEAKILGLIEDKPESLNS